MHLDVLQSISLNGVPGRANDDRCGSVKDLAWVIDGATDLGPPGLFGQQGGAAWLASTADACFPTVRGPGVRATCQGLFRELQTRFDRDRLRDPVAAWEIPKAAFAAVQLDGDKVQVAWAADCPVLHATADQVRWCTGTPDTSAEADDARALAAHGVGQEISGAVLADRRAHRSRDGHAALGPDAVASETATRFAEYPVCAGDELLLMTDGFASLVSDYGRYDARSLMRAVREVGLAQLALDIRRIEQEDAACVRFPRFKISDDATAIWLKVAG